MSILDHKIKLTILKEKERRWYVVLETPFNGVKTIKRAICVWLKFNPAFLAIPTGYAIHHLDGDSLNDDPSNLVLMQKHHHLAHHLKYKTISPTTFVYETGYLKNDSYQATKEPKIRYEKRINRWMVVFWIIENGKKRRIRRCGYGGSGFKTKEEAQEFKDMIWENGGVPVDVSELGNFFSPQSLDKSEATKCTTVS